MMLKTISQLGKMMIYNSMFVRDITRHITRKIIITIVIKHKKFLILFLLNNTVYINDYKKKKKD